MMDRVLLLGDVQAGHGRILIVDPAAGAIDGVVETPTRTGTSLVTPVCHAAGGLASEFPVPDGGTLSVPASYDRAPVTDSRAGRVGG